MNWFYREMPKGFKTPNSKSKAMTQNFRCSKKKFICTYFVSLKILTSHSCHKCLFIYFACSFVPCGIFVFLWPKQGVPVTLSYCFFLTQPKNRIASGPITKDLGLCGVSPARRVAKLQNKTQDPSSLCVSGAAVSSSAVAISVPSLKSKHICPPDRKMPNEVTSSLWTRLVVLFSP